MGLRTSLSSAATNAPVTFTFDDLLVTHAGRNQVRHTSTPTRTNLLLLNSTGEAFTQSFGYDSIGRVISRTTDTVTRNYVYTDTNHVHAVTRFGPGREYAYDENGNAIKVNGATLAYDRENRLTSFTSASGVTTTTYTYDGDGNRVKQVVTVNGVSTSTYYVGNTYEVSVSGGTTTPTKYYYFGTQRIAVRNGSTLSFILGDHLGSTAVTTDQNGNGVNS